MADPKTTDCPHGQPAEVDEEAALPSDQRVTVNAIRTPTRPGLRRQDSGRAPSVRSLSRRNTIEASAELPILYRTLSIDVGAYAQGSLPLVTDAEIVAEIASLPWHTLSAINVAIQLATSSKAGLSSDEVARRHTQCGKNTMLSLPSHRPGRIVNCFFKGFGPVLLAASILAFIAWKPLGDPPATANLALAIVLAVVFVLHGALAMWQDWPSVRIVRPVRAVLRDDCLVLRDGQIASVAASLLVPGDVLMVKAGDMLPADVRFVETSASASASGAGVDDPRFDRSILTGVLTPLPAAAYSTDDNYLETRCIGLQGTHCVSGTCKAIVVTTGDSTVLGRIAQLINNEPAADMSTLEREIFHVVVVICSIMLAVVVLVVVLWAAWLRHSHAGWLTVSDLLMSIMSVAVALMPMGLPVALAASLAIGANRLRKKNILCKSPKTVDTLGSMSIICADMTGIVTKNEMHVTKCSVGGRVVMCPQEARDELMVGYNTRYNKAPVLIPAAAQYDGVGFNRAARYPVSDRGAAALDQLRTVAALCNDAQFDAATRHLHIGEQTIHGNAIDQAILRFSETIGAAGSVAQLRSAWSTAFTLPFKSQNKCMVRALSLTRKDGLAMALPTAVASAFQPNDLLLAIKGAADVLLGRVQYCIGPSSGDVFDFTDEFRARVLTTNYKWAVRGARVILLARKTLSATSLPQDLSSPAYKDAIQRHAMSGLTLVGLVAVFDKPRPEIGAVAKTLRRAGVRMFVVTGEHDITARALAKSCGLITASHATGTKIDTVADLPLPANSDSDEDSDADSAPFGEQPFAPLDSRKSIVLSGPEMEALNYTQWNFLAQYQEVVFARTTPAQKLQIVRELRARSYIVGVTGNDVSDAPSLRAANVGITMGSSCTIVREAADIVLLDNSFESIITALGVGRLMFDNLRKMVVYLLPAGTYSEFWPVITNVVFGMPQILSSFLMIVICLFTDPIAAIALAHETSEADALRRPPRLPGKVRLVDWKLLLQAYGITGTIETVCSFSMAYWYLARCGIPFFSAIWFRFGNLPDNIDADYYAAKLNVASSIYFVSLVVMQWFNLLAMRTRRLSIFQHSPSNMMLLAAIEVSVIMVIFLLYVPTFQTHLGNMPVPVEYWFLPMVFGMGILLLDEGRKYCMRSWPTGGLARIAW